jgi:hypothetical protein
MYTGVALAFLAAFGRLALDTAQARGGRGRPGTIRVAGLVGRRGVHVAAWGIALVLLAAPIDELWHRLFGLDITIWSPPHLLGLLGSAVNTLGTLVAAIETYAPGSRARRVAVLLSGALLYGAARVLLDPAWLTAYRHGGIAFHTFGMLGALLLPLALVPAARARGGRWAPVAVVAAALAIGVIGERIAELGFAVVQPVSVLTRAIVEDPTSAIAQAAAIRAKSGGAVAPIWLRLLLPLVAAGLMAAIDPRRRPAAAGAAYGVTLLALYGWSAAASPAYAPLVPSATVTGAAVVLAALAGVAGATLGRRLAGILERSAHPGRPYITGPMIHGANSSSPTPESSLLERLPEATATISSKI